MPKVGGKHYSYSKSGRTAAKAESKRTGKPMTRAKPKPKPTTRKPTRKY